jgi:hypothetical protein
MKSRDKGIEPSSWLERVLAMNSQSRIDQEQTKKQRECSRQFRAYSMYSEQALITPKGHLDHAQHIQPHANSGTRTIRPILHLSPSTTKPKHLPPHSLPNPPNKTLPISPPAPSQTLKHPHKNIQPTQPHRHPSQHHKPFPLLRCHPNILSVFINHMSCLDCHSSRDSRSQQSSKERESPEKYIDESGEASMDEEREQRKGCGEDDQAGGNAIQKESGFLCEAQSVDARVDCIRPMQIFQRQPSMRFIQLPLQRNRRIEMEERGAIATSSNILSNLTRRKRNIRQRSRCIKPLAIIQ